jgi:protein-disulfide isomerase
MSNPNMFFLSLGAICGSIIIAGGLIAWALVSSNSPRSDSPSEEQNSVEGAREVSFELAENDPTLGSSDAPVTIVEFSDYGCPFCKKFHAQTFSQIKKQYIENDKVEYRYKHRPVTKLHPQAKTQAIAAQCVYSLQGDEAFFDYTNRLFQNQKQAKTKEALINLAEKTEVNTDTFSSCLANKETQAKVEADNSLALQKGMKGTPTFAIGTVEDGEFTGRILVGAQPYSRFQPVIDAFLN